MNDQSAAQAVRAILNPKVWAVQSVTQIPLMLARWEGLQREHIANTQEKVLTSSAARALLLEMIPVKVTEHIRTQMLLMKREDLTYEKLRQFIVDYSQQVAPLTATPMDISAL